MRLIAVSEFCAKKDCYKEVWINGEHRGCDHYGSVYGECPVQALEKQNRAIINNNYRVKAIRTEDLYLYRDEGFTLLELSRAFKIPRGRLTRLLKTYTPEEIVANELHKKKSNSGRKPILYTLFGVTRTLKEWAEELGVAKETLVSRLDRGLSFEEACGS